MDKSLMLSKIRKHFNFKTDAQFARHLEIKPQVLSNWKARNTFDPELIYTKCLELNPEWLLTGKGKMLKEQLNVIAEPIVSSRKTKDGIKEIQQVPLFDLEATMGLIPYANGNGLDNEHIEDYLSIPDLPESDGAIRATGDSMYPLLKSGDIIIYKTIPIDRDYIYFGEIYVLAIYLDESTTMKTIKFIQPSPLGDEYIQLISHNQHHRPKDVKLQHIAAMALVRASIRIHN